MALLDESNNSIKSVGGGVPPGIDGKDPAALMAMEDLQRQRGSLGFKAQSAVMGASEGAKAGQGALNPLTAFVQGAAAGLQVPAAIFAQRQAQVKSTLDAMPFGVRFQELGEKYPLLKGMPSSLALETIKAIAIDTEKVVNEHNAKLGEISATGTQQRANALFEQSLKGKDPAKYEDISAMAKDFRAVEEVQQYKLAKVAKEMIIQAPDDAAGDLMIMANYARMLNPQTRFSEGNLDATDISSYVDKYTKGLYDKVISGKKLQPDERAKIKAAAIRAYNIRKTEYNNVANLWEEKAAELGIDSDFIVSDKGWESKTIGGKTVMARDLGNGKSEVRQ